MTGGDKLTVLCTQLRSLQQHAHGVDGTLLHTGLDHPTTTSSATVVGNAAATPQLRTGDLND